MKYDNIIDWIVAIIRDKPNPYIILLEGRWDIYGHYHRRKRHLENYFICDIFRCQGFAFRYHDKIVWYSVTYGTSRTLDILSSFLYTKNPKYIILLGSCHLNSPIEDKTIVIPVRATLEALDIEGIADNTLKEVALSIAEKRRFNVILSNNHLTKLSLTYDIVQRNAESIDMETAIVYHLANKFHIPAIAILGVSDYKVENKVEFVIYEEELKDEIFEIGLELIREVK
jgi:hypothetical protein